ALVVAVVAVRVLVVAPRGRGAQVRGDPVELLLRQDGDQSGIFREVLGVARGPDREGREQPDLAVVAVVFRGLHPLTGPRRAGVVGHRVPPAVVVVPGRVQPAHREAAAGRVP